MFKQTKKVNTNRWNVSIMREKKYYPFLAIVIIVKKS